MLEYMCEGCLKIAKEVLECSVYANPPELWAKKQHCPMNTLLCNKPKTRKRIGQQKQKRKK